MTKKYLNTFFLVLTALWLGQSVLIDIVIVPTVFKTISDFFEAGTLGMILFYKFNYLELVFASVIVGILSLSLNNSRISIILLITAGIVFSISIFYFSFLTPKIVELTELWKNLETQNLAGTQAIPDIQQEHQFFHKLYISLDVIKIVLLSAMLMLGIYKQEQAA